MLNIVRNFCRVRDLVDLSTLNARRTLTRAEQLQAALAGGCSETEFLAWEAARRAAGQPAELGHRVYVDSRHAVGAVPAA